MKKPEIRTGESFKGITYPTKLTDDFEGSIWVDCSFAASDFSGANIDDAVFSRCHFADVVLYWCMAHRATFIDCKFVSCDLRGSFYDSRFVRCGFVGCDVSEDNVGGKTKWENAVSVECVVSGDALPIVEREE